MNEHVQNHLCLSLLQAAASKNENIKKVRFEGRIHFEGRISSSVTDLTLNRLVSSQDVVSSLPIDHSLQKLTLSWSYHGESTTDREVKCGFGGFLSDVWTKLEECSNKILHLSLGRSPGECRMVWSPSLPLYLLSYKSAIKWLDLNHMNFFHHKNQNFGPTGSRSRMDALIFGLAGSPTTTTLSFDSCEFNDASLSMLRNKLQLGFLPIKNLSFRSCKNCEPYSGTRDSAFADFLQCDALETLSFVGSMYLLCGSQKHMLKEAIANCSLSGLCLRTYDTLQDFGPPLKTALLTRNLVTLCLECTYFCVESDLDCLVGLVKDTNLEDLSLIDWRGGLKEMVAGKILKALSGETKLQKLLLHAQLSEDIPPLMNALLCNLASLKTLTSLEVRIRLKGLAFSNSVEEAEAAILSSLALNWNLEWFVISNQGEVCSRRWDDHDYECRQPCTSASFQEKAGSVCRRNQKKKDIFTTTQEVTMDELIGKLESYWKLPDSLSLAFWLLEQVPCKFF